MLGMAHERTRLAATLCTLFWAVAALPCIVGVVFLTALCNSGCTEDSEDTELWGEGIYLCEGARSS